MSMSSVHKILVTSTDPLVPGTWHIYCSFVLSILIIQRLLHKYFVTKNGFISDTIIINFNAFITMIISLPHKILVSFYSQLLPRKYQSFLKFGKCWLLLFVHHCHCSYAKVFTLQHHHV